MVGRGSQVARGLNMIASRVVKAKDELAEYGIQVEDANGNLKSTYDVLAELKPKWDNMTESERVALGETLAGINQYRVLASVMSNFQTAVDATETAYNSAGSAAQENSRFMESLEAQTNNLKATFQDFANNVITKEMISSLLNLANAFLELLNTPFGQAATRLALLTTGLTALYNVAKYFGAPFFAPLISGIRKLSTGSGVGIVERLAVALGGINPVVAGVTAGIAALGLAIYGVKKYVDEVNKPLSDFNEEIDSINSQLQSNRTRLDEINAMPWNARTSEILEEKAALEKQNEELEKNLELLNQEKYERAQEEAENFVFNTGEQKTITKGGSTSRRMSTTFDVTIGGEKAYAEAARQLEEYRRQLEQTGQITDAQRKRFDEVNAAVAEQIEWLQVLVDRGDTLTESQQSMYDAYYALGNAYDVAVNGAQALINAYTELTNTGYVTEATYQQLIALYPQLADGAVQTANGYQIQQSSLENLMSAEQRQQAEITNLVNGFIAEAQQSGATEQALMDLVYAQITASNTGLNFTQQIAALQALAQQAGYTATYVQNVLSAGLSQSNIERTARGLVEVAARKGQKLSYQDALAKATSQANKELERRWKNLTSSAPTDGYTPTFSGGSQVTVPSTNKTSSSYDDSKRSEAQAQIKQLQAQQDVIQDNIDAVNEKYDAQLKELEDINDALEDQIRLQKLLEDLAEAKSRTKMVFKDGRFQYVQDTDAVSKAQANLDEYYRDKELAAKKKRIEEERQAELAGLNAEKKNLQDRIDAWRDYINGMSGQYSSSLSGLQSYVDNWNYKIGQMKETPDYSGGGGDETPKDDKPAAEDLTKYKPTGATSSDIRRAKTYLGWSVDGYWSDADARNLKQRNMTYSTLLSLMKTARAKSVAQYNKGGSAMIQMIDWVDKKIVANLEEAYMKYANKMGYAKGTLSAQSGLSMVGEQGPELRVLNQGDGIIPAKQTATLWSFANDPAKFLQTIANYRGGMSDVINVQNVTLPNVRNAQDFVAGLRNLAYQRAYVR